MDNNHQNIPEINLVGLTRNFFNALGSFIKTIGRFFLKSAVFIASKILWVLLFVVVGVVFSLVLNRTAEKSFSSELILASNTLKTADLITSINSLHEYCIENKTDEMASLLGISVEDASEIIDIEAFWIIDRANDEIPDFIDYKNNHDVYDTTNVRMQTRIAIRAIARSTNEYENIKNGIFDMVNSDPFIVNFNNKRVQLLDEILEAMSGEIANLDSLQQVEYFVQNRTIASEKGQLVFLEDKPTQLYHNEILSLYRQNQKYKTERELYSDPITLIKDFNRTTNADNDYISYAVKWISISLLIGLLILVIVHFRSDLKEIYRKNL